MSRRRLAGYFDGPFLDQIEKQRTRMKQRRVHVVANLGSR